MEYPIAWAVPESGTPETKSISVLSLFDKYLPQFSLTFSAFIPSYDDAGNPV